MYAHCHRSGEIEISRKKDLDGQICFAAGPARELRRKLDCRARHAYDGKTLLVPGLPEAETDKSAMAALKAFEERMKL